MDVDTDVVVHASSADRNVFATTTGSVRESRKLKRGAHSSFVSVSIFIRGARLGAF